MPSSEQSRLLPSVVDRLLDPDSMGGIIAGYDQRKMFARIRADLEDLLNTRQTAEIPDDLPEVRNSIVNYGMPDIAAFATGSAADAEYLADAVRDIIAHFEPRLKNIRVAVVRDTSSGKTAVRFHVEAQMNLNPAPEVGFETVVELITGRATVKSDGGVG